MPQNRICATISPFTRDDPRYWLTNRHSDDHPQPADHTEAGFFIGSPGERAQPVAQNIGDRESPFTPESPLTALARTDAQRAHRLRMLARALSFAQAVRQKDGPFVRRGPTRWSAR